LGTGGLIGVGGMPGPLCPPGTYATDPTGFECLPWTECSWEFPELVPPSSTTDRLCGGPQPFRQFGTYGADEARDVVVDDLGNVYVVGSTTDALDGPASGSYDAFVRKYSPKGELVWGYQGDLGGFENAVRVARDGFDRLHVMVFRDGPTAFWMFDADGSLLSEQFLDGSYADLAVDMQGTRYVTRPFFNSDDTSDIELTRLLLDGSTSSTVANGGTFDTPFALAVLPGDDVIIAGTTNGGLFAPGSGNLEGFVARFSFDNDDFVWGAQFLASGDETIPNAIALDSAGNIYVAGVTLLDAVSPAEGFVARVSAGGALEWVSVQGTAARDVYSAVAVDRLDQVAVVGATVGVFGGSNAGQEDAFVARTLGYGSLGPVIQFGSPGSDSAQGIAAAPDGAWFVVGATELALDGQASSGSYDAFVLRVPPF
jgi:hypothetical protein